jgi:membrane peptidoglycan carboxypeptidase
LFFVLLIVCSFVLLFVCSTTVALFERIPQIIKDATIAVEDANFRQNPGVDVRGIVCALWLNYQAQDVVSGGSTITQQLVRGVLMTEEERTSISFRRKLRDGKRSTSSATRSRC